jgi:cysteine desulfurase
VAYLDAASAEPLHPAARAVLLSALDDGWADPARLHGDGRRARIMLDDARQRVAAVLGCRADELSFTGSGTQAVHLAVLGTVAARRRSVRGGRHITASAVEHSSVLHAARYCEQEGAQVTVVGVDQQGRVDAAEFAAALLPGPPPAPGNAAPPAPGNAWPPARGSAAPPAPANAAPPAPGNAAPPAPGNAAPAARGHSASLAGGDAEPPGRPGRTVLACLQSANPEVGTIQPVEEVASACRRAAIPLLVDAAASAGRMPIPDGWSLLTASAHKWGGPAGLGVLAVRKGARWRNPLPHDDREGGRVPGYPNVPAALAAATALEAMDTERLTRQTALRALTDRIRARIPDVVPDTVVYGEPVYRLPHIVTFCCLYVNGEALVTELDRAGFAVSSGSACTADTLQPSHVLEAMGVVTHGNVRVSLPCATTEDTIERFLTVLPVIVAGLRGTAHHVVNT